MHPSELQTIKLYHIVLYDIIVSQPLNFMSKYL